MLLLTEIKHSLKDLIYASFSTKAALCRKRTLDMETGNPDFRVESKTHTNALPWMRISLSLWKKNETANKQQHLHLTMVKTMKPVLLRTSTMSLRATAMEFCRREEEIWLDSKSNKETWD